MRQNVFDSLDSPAAWIWRGKEWGRATDGKEIGREICEWLSSD